MLDYNTYNKVLLDDSMKNLDDNLKNRIMLFNNVKHYINQPSVSRVEFKRIGNLIFKTIYSISNAIVARIPIEEDN
jgi:hypothetical protein